MPIQSLFLVLKVYKQPTNAFVLSSKLVLVIAVINDPLVYWTVTLKEHSLQRDCIIIY